MLKTLAYCIWLLNPHEPLNKPVNSFIARWQYFSSKADRFNNSIHISTYILPISHPMPLMEDDLFWTYK